MFYSNEKGYRKEFTIIAEENYRPQKHYYVHQDCWKALIKLTEAFSAFIVRKALEEF